MKKKLLGIVSILFLLSLDSFAQNTRPNAVDDAVAICGNSGTINIVVQANDNDAEGNALSTSIYIAPQNGFAVLSGNTINYTPVQNFSGNDTLEYVICDNGTPSLCDTAMVIITVHSVPVADAGSNATICRYDSLMIGTPGTAGVNYQWTPSAGLNASNIAQPTASPAATTSYIVTATDPITGCSSADTVTITINPVPIADAGTGSTSCQGDSVLLGTPGIAGNTYYWTPIPPLSWNNIPQPEAAPFTTTTFTLIVTTTATGCQSMDTVTITINPRPNANAGPNLFVCDGDSVLLGSPAIAGMTYSWSPATGLSATNIAQPTAHPGVTTTYTLTVTNTTTGCHDTATATVTIGTGSFSNAGPDVSSCDGDSVQIGATLVLGYSYFWSPSAGLSATNIAQPMADPAVTTTYTLIVSNASGCNDTDEVVVNVGTSPLADAGADQQICAGQSVQIGTPGSPTNSYSWSPSTGLDSAIVAQPNASPSATTSYVLTVTASPSGCSSTDTVLVTVNPLPVANAGADQTSCNGDSVLIGTPAVSGITYSWSPATGLSATNVAQPMADPATATTYTLTITNANGCTNTDSVNVNIGTVPVANAGADQTVCSGDSVQIGTAGVAGNVYSWSPSTGLDSANIAQPMAGPGSTTTYILTISNLSSGCQSTDSVIVTVDSLPLANAGADQVSCNGDSVMIGTPAVTGMTYSWSPATGLSATNVAQPMADPSVNTTYVLMVTNANSCTSTDTVNVNVGTVPAANAGADQIICNGDSVQIGSASVSGNVYSWSPSAGLDSASLAQPMAGPSSTTTYILTITNSASGCQSTDSVIVTVNTLPVANAGADQISCNGDSVMIGSPAVSGVTYSWSPATGLDSANVAQPMALPSATTTYILTVSSTSTGCQNTDTVVVSIGTAITANAGIDTAICSGDSIQIGSPAVAGTTYSWSPTTGLSASNVAQPMASPSDTTTYIVTVTNTAGCTGTDSVLITVNPLPTADAGANQTICNGDSVQIGTPAVSGMTYIWAPATGLSSVFAAQPMAAPSSTTTYTVTVGNASTNCSQTDTVTVTITPGPVANAGADVTICNGDNTTIGTPSVSGMTYSWSPATGLSATNVAQPTANPSTTTTYIVTVNNGSCSDMDTILVTVNMPPVADAGNGGSVCIGNSINIGTAPVSGYTYSWSPGTGLNSTTDPQPDASPSTTTTYTLTVSNGTCSATDTVTVDVNRPFANAGNDIMSCDASNVLLGSPAVAGFTYSWSPNTGLNDPYAAQPTAYPGTTTTYTLTVTDTASGCMSSDEVVFTVGGGGNIFNAISPNGDGNNDWWNVPVLECFSDNKVVIVNRWGNEIWTAANYNNKEVRWNGQNMNGQDVPDGTYYYIISYNGKELHGWVLVKR